MTFDHDTQQTIELPKPSLLTKLVAAILVAVTLVGTFFAGLIVLATGLVGGTVLMLALKWQNRRMKTESDATMTPASTEPHAHPAH